MTTVLCIPRSSNSPTLSPPPPSRSTTGEVKKIVSTSRTSQNAWCTRECENLPLVRSVTQRIQAVTGVPHANYEQFQVLRYEEGQYYKPHHDAGAACPLNPRICSSHTHKY